MFEDDDRDVAISDTNELLDEASDGMKAIFYIIKAKKSIIARPEKLL